MEPHLQIVPSIESHACLNCGSSLTGRFCASCGQASDTHRITLKHWLHDIPHSIWHVDKGLPYTLGQMLRRPGATLLRYLAGQRAPFFRPLTMLLLITGLMTFAYVSFDLRPYNIHDTALSPEVNAFRDRFIEFFTRYINWFTVAMVPVSALLLRLGLRRANLNYAECLTVMTFVTAASHFISLMALPLLYFVSGTANGQILMTVVTFLTMAYQVWAFTGLLAGSGLGLGGRLVRGLATAAAISTATLIAVTLLIGYVNRDQLGTLRKQLVKPPATSAPAAAAAPRPAATP